MEAHGGRIHATSPSPGRGTTITFTVPVAPGLGTATVAAQPAPPASAGESPRILVVDDDPRTLRFVRDALSRAGYAPLVTGAPEDLAALVRAEQPRLVLLDLVLPGRDGIELLEQIPELAETPVIFISAYGRDETVARAFEAGAADFVKPFCPTELVARVGAVLRRHEEPEPFALGDIAIRYDTRAVTVAGRSVDLTASEYELLRVLSQNAGRVVPFDTLVARLWPDGDGGDANRMRIFVKQLRDKLRDRADRPGSIFNVRGVGYRMPRPGTPDSRPRGGRAGACVPDSFRESPFREEGDTRWCASVGRRSSFRSPSLSHGISLMMSHTTAIIIGATQRVTTILPKSIVTSPLSPLVTQHAQNCVCPATLVHYGVAVPVSHISMFEPRL